MLWSGQRSRSILQSRSGRRRRFQANARSAPNILNLLLLRGSVYTNSKTASWAHYNLPSAREWGILLLKQVNCVTFFHFFYYYFDQFGNRFTNFDILFFELLDRSATIRQLLQLVNNLHPEQVKSSVNKEHGQFPEYFFIVSQVSNSFGDCHSHQISSF